LRNLKLDCLNITDTENRSMLLIWHEKMSLSCSIHLSFDTSTTNRIKRIRYFDINRQSLICTVVTQHNDSRGSLHQKQTNKLQNATTDRVKAKATHEGRRMSKCSIQIGQTTAYVLSCSQELTVSRLNQNKLNND